MPAQRHLRRRLHLRADPAAQVLHRGHLRSRPAATRAQGDAASPTTSSVLPQRNPIRSLAISSAICLDADVPLMVNS